MNMNMNMKKSQTQASASGHQKTDSVSVERDPSLLKNHAPKNISIAPLNLNTINANTLNYIPHQEPSNIKTRPSTGGQNGQSGETIYPKLALAVKDLFIEMRRKTLEENQNAILLLKKVIPFDDNEDKVASIDALALLQYIKQFFLAYAQLKNEAEKELSEKKESEGSDYEPLLQKLEAEVRQHIRVEQQLKLYVESTQSKAEEVEKLNEQYKKELEEIRSEHNGLADKYKKKESELDNFKKDLKNKTEIIQNLEQQVESIPALKNKVKEMERSAYEMSKSSSYNNTLKNLNSASRDIDNYGKNVQQLQTSGDNVARKSSQPNTLSSTAELSKNISKQTEKNKENEVMRTDPSNQRFKDSGNFKTLKNNFITDKNQRLSSDSTRHFEKSAGLGRPEDRNEEVNSATLKGKKSSRLEHVSSKERLAEADPYHEERLSSNNKNYTKINEHALEQNNRANVEKVYKYNSRDSEEIDYDKNKYKRTGSHDKSYGASNSHQDASTKPSERKSALPSSEYQPDLLTSGKNNIPKPSRSSNDAGYPYPTNASHNNNNNKQSSVAAKKESSSSHSNNQPTNIQDLKAKMTSPKKYFQDNRSQSVDATNKFYRQLKSRIDNIEKENQNTTEYNSKSSLHPAPGKGVMNNTQNISALLMSNNY